MVEVVHVVEAQEVAVRAVDGQVAVARVRDRFDWMRRVLWWRLP